MPVRGYTRKHWMVCTVLIAITLATFWPLLRHDFITYDDTEYITENTYLLQGVTLESFRWAFSTSYAANWHPLTWLSHLLDVEFFGLNPGLHHLTNLLFHLANTILLFRLLDRMTATVWPSATVSALFALHPMHVESVAWASERKDVLSAFFFMLTLLAYAHYAKMSRQETPVHNRITYYLLALCVFAFGLMSKSMLVTLPFLMLLLDFWPLNRLQPYAGNGHEEKATVQNCKTRLPHIILEKLPFFALSALSSGITLYVQRTAGAMMPVKSVTIAGRVENALVAYVRYLAKAIWPTNLILPYPPQLSWPIFEVLGALLILLIVTFGVLLLARRRPYLFVGWFWFLGMLVPVIGLLQVGAQSMADRYSYLPYVGLFVMFAWTLSQIELRGGPLKWLPKAAATIAVVLCAILCRVQLTYWKNSFTLFSHAIAVCPNNYVARSSLGVALIKERRFDEATAQFQFILNSQPDDPEAHFNLATISAGEGHVREAVEHYHRGLRGNPNSADALNNLAWLLATTPDPTIRDGLEAVKLAERACELTRDQNPMMIGTLAAAYAEAGRFPDAIRCAEKASSLARQAHDSALAATNDKLLQLYRSGRPARDAN